MRRAAILIGLFIFISIPVFISFAGEIDQTKTVEWEKLDLSLDNTVILNNEFWGLGNSSLYRMYPGSDTEESRLSDFEFDDKHRNILGNINNIHVRNLYLAYDKTGIWVLATRGIESWLLCCRENRITKVIKTPQCSLQSSFLVSSLYDTGNGLILIGNKGVTNIGRKQTIFFYDINENIWRVIEQDWTGDPVPFLKKLDANYYFSGDHEIKQYIMFKESILMLTNDKIVVLDLLNNT
jgi:hypothetical protein